MDFFRKFFSEVEQVERLKPISRPVDDSISDVDAHYDRVPQDASQNEVSLELPAGNALDFNAASRYELSYACLVIPRFKSHYLIGDVVNNLDNWVREICISYNWRLEFLIIKPGHMELGISVSPAISPAHFVNLLCVHTSNLIFKEYPRYRKQNTSREFWAAGFFAAPGLNSLSENLIEEFIRSTRSSQGFQPDLER